MHRHRRVAVGVPLCVVAVVHIRFRRGSAVVTDHRGARLLLICLLLEVLVFLEVAER
jgi:hypothetical protein